MLQQKMLIMQNPQSMNYPGFNEIPQIGGISVNSDFIPMDSQFMNPNNINYSINHNMNQLNNNINNYNNVNSKNQFENDFSGNQYQDFNYPMSYFGNMEYEN